jgi:cohesin loading factor subunit SCC2
MVENFSSFEYKTQEEVFTVIKYLTSVLSTAGMQLVEVLSPSHLLSQIRGPSPSVNPIPARDIVCYILFLRRTISDFPI